MAVQAHGSYPSDPETEYEHHLTAASSVIEDEDYLNLICHNKVCCLPQKWNVEVFGQIPCREEEFCVLHYIMVSKPWHYSDCRLQEYFWKSAQKTSVYAEIRQVLESYTDEERKRDAVSCDRLMQMAKDEIAKENNYLNLVKAGKLKSKDRLEVLEKILPVLENQEDYSNDALYELLCGFAKENGYKNGQILWPIRTALSGKQMTPAGATEILEVLGKEESLKRIEAAVEKLK